MKTEYETLFVVHPDTDANKLKTLTEKIQAIVSAGGGTVLAFRDWGVRKLSYEIQKQRRGHYYQMDFVPGTTAALNELERNLRLDETIIRYLTVQLAELEDVEKRRQELASIDWQSPSEATHEHAEGHGDRYGDRRPRREWRSRDAADGAGDEM